jgi:hypothetical protein
MIHLALSIASFIFLAGVAIVILGLILRFPGFFFSLVAIVAIGIYVLLNSADASANCGFKPFKPFKPYGCQGEMVAICVCDDNYNCNWVWVCQ